MGLIGLGLVCLGLLIGLLAVMFGGAAKPDGLFAYLFAGLVLASAGVNVFAIGATFNYIVSLFHKRHIRQGLLGRPIFSAPLESHFGWLGLSAIVGGGLVYGLAIWQNWTSPVSAAPWFAPAVSTIMVLTGLQLLTSWLLIIVLAELSERDARAEEDLGEALISVTGKGNLESQPVEVAAPPVVSL